MKKIIAIAAAAIAVSLFADLPTISAQTYQNSYRFGAGMFFGRNTIAPRQGFLFRGLSRPIEEPPYFAKFPPVYYNGVISRPYGISPYAAPPGIVPVEMLVPTEPERIVNPFFNEENQPAPAPDSIDMEEDGNPKAKRANHRIKRVTNPHFRSKAY